MFKFLKKTASFGSGSKGKMNDDTLVAKSDTEPAKFEITDQSVARISDILEIAVRTKLSDPTSDPLDVVSDETVDSLIIDFLEKKIGKSEYENFSTNTLWSVAIRVLESGEQILSSDTCENLKSTSSTEVTKIVADMSLPAQRLLGIVFAAGEMFIRDEPSCAPLVLTRLANVFLWKLPANSFIAINAMVNLLEDHRRLFPSCHTFARKISSTTTHITPEEWKTYATKACAVYGQADSSSSPTDAVASSSTGTSVPVNQSLTQSSNSTSVPVNQPMTRSSSRSSVSGDQPLIPSPSSSEPTLPATTSSGRSEPRSAPWVSSKSTRASYTSDLPLNDINASASIDVSALRGQEASNHNASLSDTASHTVPIRQVGIATSSNISSSSSSSRSTNSSRSSISSPNTEDSTQIRGLGLGGTLRIKDLQGVFSSSLVSRASLDYLSIASTLQEDYADIRTLSGTIKWILQAQDLSDAVINSDKSDAHKGILSWKSFLRLASPFLVADDVAYLRTAEGAAVKYDTPVQETSVVSAANAAASKAAAETKTGRSNTATETKTGMSKTATEAKTVAPRVSAAALAKSRSRQGFKDSGSDSTSEEEEEVGHKSENKTSINDWNSANVKKSTFSTQESAESKWNIASSSKLHTTAAGNKDESWDSHSSDHSDDKQNQQTEEQELLSDVEELNLSGSALVKSTNSSTEQRSSHTDAAAIPSMRSVPLNKNINVRRQWEDSSVTSDDIGDLSITSTGGSTAARQYSGIKAGGRVPGSNTSAKLNSSRVFEMDLLDNSMSSAPLHELSMSSTRSADELRGLDIDSGSDRVPAGATEQTEGTRQRYMYNSFDEDDDSDEQDQVEVKHGGAQSGSSSRAAQLIASSFDEDSDTEQGESKQDPIALSTTESAAVDMSALTVPSIATTDVGSEDGSVKPKKGALKKAAKGAKKMFGKMFSLTSTSSNNSVISASASEASPLPTRPRLDSAASDITASDAGSIREGGASISTATASEGGKKKKSMFSKLKSKLTRSRSHSRDSAAEGVLDTASDAGSDVGSAQGVDVTAGTATDASVSRSTNIDSVTSGPSTPSQDSPIPSVHSGSSSNKLEVGIAAHHHGTAASTEAPDGSEVNSVDAALTQQPAPSRTSSFRGGIPQPALARTNSLRSEAASEASSTRTADSGTSAGSGVDGKKKRPPSLKGMVHKTYKVVFQRGGKAKDTADAVDSPSLSVGEGSSPAASPSTNPSLPASSMLSGNSLATATAGMDTTAVTHSTAPILVSSTPQTESAPVDGGPPPTTDIKVTSPVKPLKPKAVPNTQPAPPTTAEAPEKTVNAAVTTPRKQSPVKPPKRASSTAETEAKTTQELQTSASLPAPSTVRHSREMCEGSAVDDLHQDAKESKRADPTPTAERSAAVPAAGHSHGPGAPKTPSIYQALPPSSNVVAPPVTLTESTGSVSPTSTTSPPPVSQPPPQKQQQRQGQPELVRSQSDPTTTDPSTPLPAAAPGGIVVERKLSNPALKRSSFKLSSLLSAFGGSKNSSRSSSRAHSRSNSFSAAEGAPVTSAQPSPTPSSGGDRSESGGSGVHSVSRNGTGLAALLRGGSFNSASALSPQSQAQSSDPLGPRSPSASSMRTAQSASDAVFLDRIQAVLERSKAHTQAVQSKVADSNSSITSALPQQEKGLTNVMHELQMIRENKLRRQQQLADSGVDIAHKQEQADQAQLLQNWRDLAQRKEPRSLHLDSQDLQSMRNLALSHLHHTTDQSIGQSTTAEELLETTQHRMQKQRLSQVPDPLFGLRIHCPMHIERGTSHRLSKSATKLSRSLSQAWPLNPSCALSSLELDAVIATNELYSELDLALGVRLASPLRRVATRMWQKRYFVLIAEPSRNPNLAAADLEPWTKPPPAVSTSTGPAADNIGHADPHSIPVSVAPPEYFLLEYAKSAPSQWGDVPVRLLKRYALADLLSIRTDSRASKKGLEFTVTLRKPREIPSVTVPPSSVTVDTPALSAAIHAPAPTVVASAKPTWRGLLKRSQGGDKIASVVQQAQSAAGEGRQPAPTDLSHSVLPTEGSVVPMTAPTASMPMTAPTASMDIASTVPVPPTELPAAQAAPKPSVPPISTDTPSVVPSEESFVVETRWTRLLKKAQPVPSVPSTPLSTVTAPTVDQPPLPTPSTSLPPIIESAPPTPAPAVVSADGSATSGTDQPNDVESDGDSNAGSVRLSRALSGAISDAASVYSGVSTDEEGEGEGQTGDYYYRPHTHDGIQDSSLEKGQNKMETRTLRLKASSPEQRLQWVQVLHSVAQPSLLTNTTSY